jgi:hypothetical protein
VLSKGYKGGNLPVEDLCFFDSVYNNVGELALLFLDEETVSLPSFETIFTNV